jgi:hypothetical protein
MCFGATAMANDLPQSGTIMIHGAHTGRVQAVQVEEKHFMGIGRNWGVTYNKAGSGPLHLGAAMRILA